MKFKKPSKRQVITGSAVAVSVSALAATLMLAAPPKITNEEPPYIQETPATMANISLDVYGDTFIEKAIGFEFSNKKDNSCALSFKIYDFSHDEVLLQTDYIEPGDAYHWDTKELDGFYETYVEVKSRDIQTNREGNSFLIHQNFYVDESFPFISSPILSISVPQYLSFEKTDDGFSSEFGKVSVERHRENGTAINHLAAIVDIQVSDIPKISGSVLIGELQDNAEKLNGIDYEFDLGYIIIDGQVPNGSYNTKGCFGVNVYAPDGVINDERDRERIEYDENKMIAAAPEYPEP